MRKAGGTSWSTGREIANARVLLCLDCCKVRDDVRRVYARRRPGSTATVYVPLCPKCILKRRPAVTRELREPVGETVKATDDS